MQTLIFKAINLKGSHSIPIAETVGDFLRRSTHQPPEFASVVEAVESAVEIQRSMAERNTREPENSQILCSEKSIPVSASLKFATTALQSGW